MSSEPENGNSRQQNEIAIEVKDLRMAFGKQVVLDDLEVAIPRGKITGLVGGSGAGKSVLMRCIIGLLRPQHGSIKVMGREIIGASEDELQDIERTWGVLFQDGALFSSLTVGQNIEVPIREQLTGVPKALMEEVAALKLSMVGLSPDTGPKYPSQLSGGMRKRAALARALALDPDILFLDEPTAGLDPISAAAFDDLIVTLQRALGLTVVIVTHDLDTLNAACDRIAVLAQGRVELMGTMDDMLKSDHPWIREYFHGPRSRAAGLEGR